MRAADSTASATIASVDALKQAAGTLASRPVADWTSEHWTELAVVLDAARGATQLQLPTVVTGERALHRIVAGGRTDAHVGVAVQRYMDAWRTTLQDAARPDGPGLRELLMTSDDTWSGAHWTSVAAHLDAAGDELPQHLLQLTGQPSFAQVAARAATAGPDHVARRYLTAWRVHVDESMRPSAARRTAAQDLLVRVDELQPADWARLAAIADNDLDRAVRGHVQAVRDLPDLAELATTFASGARMSTQARRGLDAWSAVVDGTAGDPARLAAEVGSLVELGANTGLDTAQLRRFAALLDVDPDAKVLEAPRVLAGVPPFDAALRNLADGLASPEIVDRYLRAWSAHAATSSAPDQLRAGVRQLLEHDPAALEPAQWRSLAALVDSDADGSVLRIPTAAGGSDPLPVLADLAARGVTPRPRAADRTFALWRLGLDDASDAATLRTGLRSIVDADHPTPEQWRRLGAMLDLGPERTGVHVPQEVANRLTLDVATIAHSLAEQASGTAPSTKLQRTMGAWRAQFDIEDRGPGGLRTYLAEHLGAEGDQLSLHRWRAVRAGLDSTDLVPGSLELRKLRASDIRMAVDRLASGNDAGAVPAVIGRWRQQLDPEYLRVRQEQLQRGVSGGQLPDDFLPDELVELVPHWSARTPFERFAIELGIGLHGGTTKEGARDVVSRVLALRHAPAGMPDALIPAWRETRRLAEVNLARLDGRTPRGEVLGYSNHPDYAQVGRIRSNIELIRRMTPSTVAEPVPAAGAGDTIAW